MYLPSNSSIEIPASLRRQSSQLRGSKGSMSEAHAYLCVVHAYLCGARLCDPKATAKFWPVSDLASVFALASQAEATWLPLYYDGPRPTSHGQA